MENKTALKDTKGANIVKTIGGVTANITADFTAAAVIGVATAPWVYRGRFKALKMACVLIGGTFLSASFGDAAQKQVEDFVDITCDSFEMGFEMGSEMRKEKETQNVTN